jgi:hypothetical protein
MAIKRLRLLALPIALCSMALAACGGGGSSSSGSSEADFREAALKHARCMREHGVDMPDPTFSPGGGIKQEVRGEPGDKLRMLDAERACRKYLEAVRPPKLSKEDEQRFREQALRFARCMREHGIDMPDPTFGDGGRLKMRIDGASGAGPGSPRFDAAQEACAKFGGPKSGASKVGGPKIGTGE